MANRLKLDFTLKTNEERTSFVSQYLNSEIFQKKPPTQDELETMSNYILWGTDITTGLNSKQSKEIQLETRNKTWDTHPVESFEALLENPGFNETMIKNDIPPIKTQRTIFSREEARKNVSPTVLKQLEYLWKQIDELDLLLNFYDLAHGKRKKPPRENLIKRFNEAQIKNIKDKVSSINSYHYLKMRHLLVELRREQFTFKDTYTTPIMCRETLISTSNSSDLDTEIFCAPLGLKYKNKIKQKLFPEDRYPLPDDFCEEELKEVLKDYWDRKFFLENNSNKIFDFRNLEHIYNALLLFDRIQDEAIEQSILSTSSEFIDTLHFYINRANLNKIHLDILKLKMTHFKNQQIADIVNKQYNKSYTANYISTIFKQKIIPQINNAAILHTKIIENLTFPENFKCCKTCGKKLLIDTENFVRKSRSNDGFSNRCKRCDKDIREKKKQLKGGKR